MNFKHHKRLIFGALGLIGMVAACSGGYSGPGGSGSGSDVGGPVEINVGNSNNTNNNNSNASNTNSGTNTGSNTNTSSSTLTPEQQNDCCGSDNCCEKPDCPSCCNPGSSSSSSGSSSSSSGGGGAGGAAPDCNETQCEALAEVCANKLILINAPTAAPVAGDTALDADATLAGFGTCGGNDQFGKFFEVTATQNGNSMTITITPDAAVDVMGYVNDGACPGGSEVVCENDPDANMGQAGVTEVITVPGPIVIGDVFTLVVKTPIVGSFTVGVTMP